MDSDVIHFESYHDDKLGKFAAAHLHPDKRACPCSYECIKCGQTIFDELPENGDVYKFTSCTACNQRHIIASFKKYSRSGSVDEVIISGAVIRWWLDIIQPDDDYINVRDLPGFIRQVYKENRLSEDVYPELRKEVAAKRNSSLISMFNDKETIKQLW